MRPWSRWSDVLLAGLVVGLPVALAACDKRATDAPHAQTPPQKERVFVYARMPEDGAYDVTASLGATAGTAKLARERLVREAEKRRCTAVLLKEDWSEDVPGEPGVKKYAATGDCLVRKPLTTSWCDSW